MQRIETIDEPRARAVAQGDLFDSSKSHKDDFRNRLIWGDNHLVMASLREEFSGQIDLIYIDPPFDVGADFTLELPLGEDDSVVKEQSALEVIAYRDTWGRGANSYLPMMFERLSLMRELLSDTGTIYVHVDWHVGHYLKILLDEVFGSGNFVNELIWHYKSFHGQTKSYFPRKHDVIFMYQKTDRRYFELPRKEIAIEETIDYKNWKDYVVNGDEIRGDHYPSDVRFKRNVEKWLRNNPGQSPGKGDVLYRFQGQPEDDTWDIPYLDPKNKKERVDYATQKPEKLLERIIRASSRDGDLVADFFCGSGTTGAVAEKLGRRWIMADLGRYAVHTGRKRLIEVQRQLHAEDRPYRAFDVLNLGRYERQWWQKEALKGADEEHRRVVLEFYGAEPLVRASSPLLHGTRGRAVCHVDGIDSVFTRRELQALVEVARGAGATALTCLAWEFEMDLRMEADRLQKESDIEIRLVQIPREIMERNRTSPPPFLEVALLEARAVVNKGAVDIELTKFLPSLAEVPAKEVESLKERAMDSGFDFIDFWAVDFDYHEDQPFHHDWQDYRVRQDRSLKTVSEQGFRYDKPGKYTACVKVIDIFGADTSITVPIEYDG